MPECECFHELDPPSNAKYWQPAFDFEPAGVAAVAIAGEDPKLRRAVRVADGWVERGAAVNFYIDITPPMPWDQVGTCWASRSHPVVAVEP